MNWRVIRLDDEQVECLRFSDRDDEETERLSSPDEIRAVLGRETGKGTATVIYLCEFTQNEDSQKLSLVCRGPRHGWAE